MSGTLAVEQLSTTVAELGFQGEVRWPGDANVVLHDVLLKRKSRKREISDIFHLSWLCTQDNSSIRSMPHVSSRVVQAQHCASLLLWLHTHQDGGLCLRLLVSRKLIREVQGTGSVAIEGELGGRETIVDQAIRRMGNLEASLGDWEIQKEVQEDVDGSKIGSTSQGQGLSIRC